MTTNIIYVKSGLAPFLAEGLNEEFLMADIRIAKSNSKSGYDKVFVVSDFKPHNDLIEQIKCWISGFVYAYSNTRHR